MKSSTSALNPFAVSYIPLAKREVQHEDKESKIAPSEAAASDTHSVVDDLKLKSQHVDAAHGASPEIPDELDSKFMVEESEMDLAYLQMLFPGVSEQSLADVYNVNGGDLESAVDMLTDLESADNFPEALDIEGAQKPLSSGECSSMKAVNVTGESSCSGSSDIAVATS